MTEDRGNPIAYTVLAEGTPVVTSDSEQLGTVKRVLADEGTDIFDGIVVDTANGERFVDAPEVAELYERLVVLTLAAAQAQSLPEPSGGPAVVDVDRDDLGGTGGGHRMRDAARRTWDRLSGKS